ncbi:MAG: polyprenyl synthetase family protein [Saprospiraceae bacterium]
MEFIKKYVQLFESFLHDHPCTKEPVNLYEPADYILSLGGKRLRPIFVILGYDLYGHDINHALDAAMAVELFHNFTLLHDDIMDKADLRRGQPTVHVKYNTNTAILTGDVMMVKALQYLVQYKKPQLVVDLLQIFNKMAIEVCEGQQMDMDFESRDDVSIEEYIQMITYKTSVLIAASIQMGALIGNATHDDQLHLYQFAKNLGIAFQLQDDILDTFGESNQVGKKIGGDIIQNKKTYLFLKSLELADTSHRDLLKNHYYSNQDIEESQKVDQVTRIFTDLNVAEYARQVIEAYRDLAVSHLNACQITESKKEAMVGFVGELIARSH